ncbi:hypothetical protein TraAM80_03932 [Trypanosoma rangeli]|uniref:Uncharacterized protein n=1 Tax=Trypanosoma rangeli TaxID=5698 RepID=A0A3R7NGV0_TRYRA|nr:uncharacterized protein TraAM80_03932 [Trypanosoma rangeli]RNF06359.1 hypothetical protein TraAM80_03932 [Trypanosoma rangeli]|eukprot:RNF06359.1 hypothetical protein TraAM80_03932 [Trypanosoma rangeli]
MGLHGTEPHGRAMWRSLFLPLRERVVFASFITMLCPLQSPQLQPGQFSCREASSSTDFQPPTTAGRAYSPDEDGAATRSPLFALCGERADAIVCVLADGKVVFFDLTDEHEGPKEIRRFSTRKLRTCTSYKATCASIIPLEVTYMCRVSAVTQPTTAPPLSGSSCNSAIFKPEPTGSDRAMYLRGVVGSSDGSVEVFSEHGFVFGFVAHDVPVVAVAAIYTAEDEDAVQRQEVASKKRDFKLSPGSDNPGCQFEISIVGLGFVTCSSDGVVYVWKRDGLAIKPTMFEKSAFPSRTFKWHVVQPSSREWLLSGMGAARTPLVVHITPGMVHEIRVRSSVTFRDVEPRIKLPGSPFSRTTAIAAVENLALVARGKKVYRVNFAESRCERILTALHTVTGLYLSRAGLAVATCDSGSMLYVLSLDPMSVLGRYYVRGGGPLYSVSLHPDSHLLAIVSGDGTVEVALMPEAWNDGAANKVYTRSDVMNSIQAARALYCLVGMHKRHGDASYNAADVMLQAAEYESLLLARMAVPEGTLRYLHPATEIA